MKVTTIGLDIGKQIFRVQVTRGAVRSAVISSHTPSGRGLPTSMLLAVSQVAYIGGVLWEKSIDWLKFAGHRS